MPDHDSEPEVNPTISSTVSSDELRVDAGGFDYGWPDATIAIADPEFVRLLDAAEINGVAYTLVPRAEAPPLPMISLVAEKAEPLRQVFRLFERWGAMSGVGSISVAIGLEEPGYSLAIGTDSRALHWRCCGFQNVARPESFGLIWCKSLDSRNDFITSLAVYSQNIVAPVYLGAALAARSASCEIAAIPLGVEPILLPGIEIEGSSLRAKRDGMRTDQGPAEEACLSQPDAATISRDRGRRLKAIAPKTLHDLRYTSAGQALLEHLAPWGVSDWQVGQAIANLGLVRQLDRQASPAVDPEDRWEAIYSLRLGQVELAASPVELDGLKPDAVLEQIRLDVAFLLRRLERLPAEPSFEACQAALRESGHL